MQADQQVAADIAALGLHAVLGSADDLARPGLRAAATAAGSALIRLNDDGAALTVLDRGNGPGRDRPGIAIEMLSSGTTGALKRIPLRYASLEAAYAAASPGQEAAGDHPIRLRKRPALIWSPLVHISGMYFAVDCVYTGRPAVLLERFDPEAWARAVQLAPALCGRAQPGRHADGARRRHRARAAGVARRRPQRDRRHPARAAGRLRSPVRDPGAADLQRHRVRRLGRQLEPGRPPPARPA